MQYIFIIVLFNSIIHVINPKKKQKQKKLANSIITINQSRAVARVYILVQYNTCHQEVTYTWSQPI